MLHIFVCDAEITRVQGRESLSLLQLHCFIGTMQLMLYKATELWMTVDMVKYSSPSKDLYFFSSETVYLIKLSFLVMFLS